MTDDEKKYFNPKATESNIDSDSERIAVELSLGHRKPQNKWEEDLVKQMDEIAARGGIIDIPSN